MARRSDPGMSTNTSFEIWKQNRHIISKYHFGLTFDAHFVP